MTNYSPAKFSFYELMFTLICTLPDASYSHTFLRINDEIFMRYARLRSDGTETDILVLSSDSDEYQLFFRSPAGPTAKKMMSDYNAGRLKSNTVYLRLTPINK